MFAPTMIETALMANLGIENAVANSMVFTQTDDYGLFIMDETSTYGNPDPPRLGQVVNFNLGGLWTQPVDIDHTNFKCHLFGALVYNENFPQVESVDAGFWSVSIPFDVPSVAPTATYYVTVSAVAQDGSELFSIDTNFRF